MFYLKDILDTAGQEEYRYYLMLILNFSMRARGIVSSFCDFFLLFLLDLLSEKIMQKQNLYENSILFLLDLATILCCERNRTLPFRFVLLDPISVHARKKLAHERQFTRASLSARTIALNYLELHTKYKVSCCWNISNVLIRTDQDKAELWKHKVTVTSVAVATTKFPFVMCDCTVDSNPDTGGFSLVLGFLRMCGHAHVSPSMDCFLCE